MYVHFIPRDYHLLNMVDDPDLLHIFQDSSAYQDTDDFALGDDMPIVSKQAEKHRNIPTRNELNEHIRFIYNYEPQPLLVPEM